MEAKPVVSYHSQDNPEHSSRWNPCYALENPSYAKMEDESMDPP